VNYKDKYTVYLTANWQSHQLMLAACHFRRLFWLLSTVIKM